MRLTIYLPLSVTTASPMRGMPQNIMSLILSAPSRVKQTLNGILSISSSLSNASDKHDSVLRVLLHRIVRTYDRQPRKEL